VLLSALLSGSSSAVERQLPKLDVAGSIPVSRSTIIAQPLLNLLASRDNQDQNHARTLVLKAWSKVRPGRRRFCCKRCFLQRQILCLQYRAKSRAAEISASEGGFSKRDDIGRR
jgi:hypothetical protein